MRQKLWHLLRETFDKDVDTRRPRTNLTCRGSCVWQIQESERKKICCCILRGWSCEAASKKVQPGQLLCLQKPARQLVVCCCTIVLQVSAWSWVRVRRSLSRDLMMMCFIKLYSICKTRRFRTPPGFSIMYELNSIEFLAFYLTLDANWVEQAHITWCVISGAHVKQPHHASKGRTKSNRSVCNKQ